MPLPLRILLLLLSVFVVFSGCELTNDNQFTPQIVIQGFLYANEPIDSIVIRKTLSITSNNESDRVVGAKVTLSVDGVSYQLEESTQSAIRGVYVPPQPLVAVPGKTYRLTVEALGQVATSETTVPLPIHLDSVKYRGRMLSLTEVDTVDYPVYMDSLSTPAIYQWWSESKGAAGYGVEAVSLDPSSDEIVLDLPQQLPDSVSLGRYRFLILSTTEQVVWLQFKRYGLNAIRALALDLNYQDYVLSSYISGSQFNNNTLHVTGGVGVFASAARTFKQIYIR